MNGGSSRLLSSPRDLLGLIQLLLVRRVHCAAGYLCSTLLMATIGICSLVIGLALLVTR
jgi:hypothetical protein